LVQGLPGEKRAYPCRARATLSRVLTGRADRGSMFIGKAFPPLFRATSGRCRACWLWFLSCSIFEVRNASAQGVRDGPLAYCKCASRSKKIEDQIMKSTDVLLGDHKEMKAFDRHGRKSNSPQLRSVSGMESKYPVKAICAL